MELPAGGTVSTDANVSRPADELAGNGRDNGTLRKPATKKGTADKTGDSKESSSSSSSSPSRKRRQAKLNGRRNDQGKDRPY